MRKVLVFYSRSGAGHLRVAQTLAGQLRAMDATCRVVLCDGLERARFGLRIDPARGYGILSTHLIRLFNLLYRLTDSALGVRALRAALRWFWGDWLARVVEREAPDLVVSTFHFISPSTLGRTHSPFRWVTVVTDLGIPHRVWFDPRADAIVLPVPDMAHSAGNGAGIPRGRLVVLDHRYPIDPRFTPVHENGPMWESIMLVGGGLGAGNIAAQVTALRCQLPEKKLVVVCGYNAKLRRQLLRLEDPQVEVHGFVDNLDELMRGVDIVVTKAGPATIVEAAVLRKPLVITAWVGLQEKGNVDLVLREKLGLYCPGAAELPDAVRRIYRDYDAYVAHDHLFQSSAREVAAYLCHSSWGCPVGVEPAPATARSPETRFTGVSPRPLER